MLNLSTDRAFYAAGEQVAASLELSNGGNAFSGYVEVVIEDARGFSVERVVAQQPVELAYGARNQRQYQWNTGSVFAGSYRVHAYLYAADHTLVADQVAVFGIGESRGFSSQVYSDRQSYAGNSEVLVTASVAYATGNALFDGAIATLRIVDADAVIVAERDFELGTMLPGDTRNFGLGWNTALSFAVGAVSSAAAGYLGMFAATKANVRSTTRRRLLASRRVCTSRSPIPTTCRCNVCRSASG